MENTGRDRSDLRTMKLTIVLYAIAFSVKLTGFFLTGIIVLLADALHSLSDIFVYVFLLISMVWSRKEADELHMFGYGRAQNVAALVAATLFISFTSYKLLEESIPRLFQPVELEAANFTLAFTVIGVSLVIPMIPLVRLMRQKRREAAARAHFLELFNDELSTLAALVGTLFLMWDYPVVNPVAAIIVAVLIAFNGIRLFKENLCVLIGRSPGKDTLDQIKALATSVEGVQGIHGIRAELIGPDTVYATMHIEVPRGMSVEETDRISKEVHRTMEKTIGCRYCVIHVDPSE
jgi:cation diffusion facilitator family transporter